MKHLQDKTRNVHISYDQKVGPHDQVIAELVCNYAEDDASILDIGCGVGHTLSEIQKRKSQLKMTAVDIDEKCLEITSKRVTLQNRIHIRTIEDLFAMRLTVDVLIMSHSLEHMYRPVDTVQGVLKMLRPGGILILAVPNPVRPLVFLGNLWKTHYVNRGHVCAWDRSHWINFLENILGLDVICYSQDYVPLLPFATASRLLFVRPFEKLLARVFPWLSFSNIAVIKNSDTSLERP
jgi:2-polyprenyl-3-methyl-5-hydroxy-6-metoxy-1,4-benzoquinol methylase